jgi:hypothetical protein
MLRLQLVNQDDASDEVNILGEQVVDYSPDREHTAVDTWGMTLAPADGSIKDRLGDHARIYKLLDDGTWHLLFDGELLAAEVDRSGGIATVEGEGVATRLKRSANTVVYEDVRYWVAIRDYVETYLDEWDWVVYEPSGQTLRDDEILLDLPEGEQFDAFIDNDVKEPYFAESDSLRLLQSCLLRPDKTESTEGGALDRFDSSTATGASDAHDVEFGGSGNDIPALAGWQMGFEYDLDADAEENLSTAPLDFYVRHRFPNDSWTGRIEYRIDGNVVGTFDTSEGDDPANYSTYTWYQAIESRPDFLGFGNHFFEVVLVENDSGNDDVYNVDAIAPLDNRFNYTFTSSPVSGSLEGPELYPDQYDFQLQDAGLGSNLNKLRVDSTLVDSEFGEKGAFRVRNNASASYEEFTQEDFTVDFDTLGEFGNRLDLVLRLSRYASDTSTSPVNGDTGMKITKYQSYITTDDIAVISGTKEFSGTDLDILQQLHNEGRMRFTVLYDDAGAPYKAESYRKGDIVENVDWKVISKTTGEDIHDYWNSVTVYGRRRPNGRLEADERATQEIQNSPYGERPNSKIFSRVIDDADQLRTEAVQFLLKGVDGDVKKADLEVPAKNIPPGYSYKIELGGG